MHRLAEAITTEDAESRSFTVLTLEFASSITPDRTALFESLLDQTWLVYFHELHDPIPCRITRRQLAFSHFAALLN